MSGHPEHTSYQLTPCNVSWIFATLFMRSLPFRSMRERKKRDVIPGRLLHFWWAIAARIRYTMTNCQSVGLLCFLRKRKWTKHVSANSGEGAKKIKTWLKNCYELRAFYMFICYNEACFCFSLSRVATPRSDLVVVVTVQELWFVCDFFVSSSSLVPTVFIIVIIIMLTASFLLARSLFERKLNIYT